MQLHVATFHKAASNWSRRLFRAVADSLGHNIWTDSANDDPINKAVDRGAGTTLCIYAAGNHKAYRARAVAGEPVVLCVRDPKDIVVSQYFSWRNSHVNNTARMLTTREKLAGLSPTDGMKLLVQDDLISMCRAVRPWKAQMTSGEAIAMKYEDLIEDFETTFKHAARHIGADLTHEYTLELKEKFSFRALAKRDPGDADETSHYRNGLPGDWRNYFDAELAKLFDEVYGADCQFLGYNLAHVSAAA